MDEFTMQDTLFWFFAKSDSMLLNITSGLHRERRYLVISSHSTFPCVRIDIVTVKLQLQFRPLSVLIVIYPAMFGWKIKIVIILAQG